MVDSKQEYQPAPDQETERIRREAIVAKRRWSIQAVPIAGDGFVITINGHEIGRIPLAWTASEEQCFEQAVTAVWWASQALRGYNQLLEES